MEPIFLYSLRMKIQTDIDTSNSHFVQTAQCESPCRCLHGHTFHHIIEVEGDVKEDGMIIDFRIIKNIIHEYDHKVLIPDLNISGIKVIRNDKEYLEISINDKEYKFPRSDVFLLEGIPVVTSEYIALYLKNKLSALYPFDNFTVTVYEGNNSYART